MERAVGVPLILVNNVCSGEEVRAAAQAYAEWIAAMENKDVAEAQTSKSIGLRTIF